MHRPQLIVLTYEKGQIQLSLFQQNLVLNLLKHIFFSVSFIKNPKPSLLPAF